MRLEQATIPTNKVLGGTENYLNYILLLSYFIVFIFMLLGVDFQTLFYMTFIPSVFIVAGNVWSFKHIEKRLHDIEYEFEIRQLTDIIHADSENTEAYFWRGQTYQLKGKYQYALRDFRTVQKLDISVSEDSDYIKNRLGEDIKYCEEKLAKRKK